MPRMSFRGFTGFDAAVLGLAAMAGVFGIFVESSGHWPDLRTRPRDGWWDAVILARKVRECAAVLVPIGWAMTAAVLGLGFRLPRAERRLLSRRPGLAACRAATVAYAIDFVATRSDMAYNFGSMMGLRWIIPRWSKVIGLFADHLFDLQLPGYAVLAAWLTLGLGGRWREERSWVDRAGRALGFWWVAMIGFGWLLNLG